MRACIVESSNSRVRSSLTFFNRSMGSKISRIAWLSSILSRRFEATKSAKTPGSLILSVTITISGGKFFRFKICSIFSLAVRMSASTSMGTSGNVGSITLRILTSKNGRSRRQVSISPLERPWTRIFTRPSASFSLRMIEAMVPTR